MADPPRQGRGPIGLFFAALVVLCGCGVAAVVVSSVERSDPAVAEAAPTSTTVVAAERVVPPPTTDRPEPTTPAPVESGSVAAVDVLSGLVYGSGAIADGALPLLLDLHIPVAADGSTGIQGRPAAILVHGGGFTQGSRADDDMARLATALAEAGIVVASIDHRLAGHDPLLTNPALAAHLDGLDPAIVDEWLAEREVVGAAIEDVWTAAEWLLARGVDDGRLVYGGSSAGAIASLYAAHLGDDLGIDTPRVGAVIDLWGGYTLTPGVAAELDAGDAPVWVAHGTDDPIVPFVHATAIVERGAAVGVDVDLHALDAGHGFAAIDLFADRTEAGDPLIDDLLAFLAATW